MLLFYFTELITIDNVDFDQIYYKNLHYLKKVRHS